jgi:hypothetical protein
LPPHRPPGLYEELVTRRLEAALDEIRGEGWRDEINNLDPAEPPGVPATTWPALLTRCCKNRKPVECTGQRPTREIPPTVTKAVMSFIIHNS